MEEKTESHPSYGIISITRISTNTDNLFGSPISNHFTTFRVRVSQAVVDTSMNESTYIRSDFKDQIVELELSATQFTELITNMNCGDGIPCTIRRLGNKPVEPPPVQKLERKRIKDRFDSQVKGVFTKLASMEKDVVDLLGKKTVNKSDKDSILQKIQSIRREVESNLPFLADLFSEATEDTISAAKKEIDAFVTNTLVSLGAERLKALSDPEKKLLDD